MFTFLLPFRAYLGRFFKGNRVPVSIDLFFLFFCSLLLLGTFLGDRPLANPDEGRYLEIPREMFLSGDFITPRLNGIKYFEKPPFFYWMEIISFSLFGVNVWAGRLVSAFLSFLLIFGVYGCSRHLFGRETGILGALSLLTCCMYFTFSHMVILDMALTAWTGLGLLFFISGMYTPPSLKRRLLFYGNSLFLSFAILTKGFVALVVPGGIIFLWLLLYKKWKDLFPLYLPSCLFIFLAVTAPWHILVSIKNPEFAWFYFVHEHFLRFTTKTHGRYQPFWFFIPVLVIGTFPWITYAFSLILASLKKRLFPEKEGFFFLWITVFFIFFSLSHSKLITYILPLFPALAIILGNYFADPTTFTAMPSRAFKGYLGLAFILGLGGMLYAFLSEDRTEIPQRFFYFIPFLMIFLLSPCLIYVFLSSLHQNKREFFSIFFGISLFYLGLSYCSPLIPYNSTQRLANLLKNKNLKETDIVFYHAYPYDLSFYLNRPTPIPLVSWVGELSYGMKHETRLDWIWSEQRFWKEWNSSKPLCAVLKENLYVSLAKENKIIQPPLSSSFSEKNVPSSPYVMVCNF